MKTLVLVFHQFLDRSRANRLMAHHAAQQGLLVRYMYDIYPDGDIDVAAEQQLLLAADRIVLQFPLQWYSSPALLKEWQDQVFTYGWAYATPEPALQGKEFIVACTTGAPAEIYDRSTPHQWDLNDLLRPFQATTWKLEAKYLQPFYVKGALTMSQAQLQEYAQDYVKHILTPDLPELGDWE